MILSIFWWSAALNMAMSEKNTKIVVFFSNCLLRPGVLRVFVLFCVLVFVRAILSWRPLI